MTKLQKIAILVCAVGLVGVQVNAFELPYKPYQTQTQQIQNNDKVAAIKERIKFLENKMKNLPKEIAEAKQQIKLIEKDLEEIDSAIGDHLFVNKECSNPMLNEAAKRECEAYQNISLSKELFDYKSKVQNMLSEAKEIEQKLEDEEQNIPLYKKIVNSLKSQLKFSD